MTFTVADLIRETNDTLSLDAICAAGWPLTRPGMLGEYVAWVQKNDYIVSNTGIRIRSLWFCFHVCVKPGHYWWNLEKWKLSCTEHKPWYKNFLCPCFHDQGLAPCLRLLSVWRSICHWLTTGAAVVICKPRGWMYWISIHAIAGLALQTSVFPWTHLWFYIVATHSTWVELI